MINFVNELYFTWPMGIVNPKTTDNNEGVILSNRYMLFDEITFSLLAVHGHVFS